LHYRRIEPGDDPHHNHRHYCSNRDGIVTAASRIAGVVALEESKRGVSHGTECSCMSTAHGYKQQEDHACRNPRHKTINQVRRNPAREACVENLTRLRRMQQGSATGAGSGLLMVKSLA